MRLLWMVNLDGEGEAWRNGSAGKWDRIVPPIRSKGKEETYFSGIREYKMTTSSGKERCTFLTDFVIENYSMKISVSVHTACRPRN